MLFYLNHAAKSPVFSSHFDSTKCKLTAIVYHCSSLLYTYLQAQIMNKFTVYKASLNSNNSAAYSFLSPFSPNIWKWIIQKMRQAPVPPGLGRSLLALLIAKNFFVFTLFFYSTGFCVSSGIMHVFISSNYCL